MKNILNKIILPAAALVSVTGCFAELDLQPIDSDTPSHYFSDSTSCAKALVGCYDALSKHSENLFTGAENSQFCIWNITDEMYNNAAGTGPKVYSYTSGYSVNQSMYRQLYVAIQRCSQLLHYLPDVDINPEDKAVMDGEARFIRAFCYFNLVQNWGRVPLITDAVEDVNNPYADQAEEADIYDFVIREMTTAESEVLPITEYGFGGRVNKSAVRAMLARVCLFKAGYPCYDETKYSEAYKWAKMVIDDPAHSLIPNFADVFIPLIQDKYDIRENLWEIESYFVSTSDGRQEYIPSLSVTLGTNCSKAVTDVCFQVSNTKYATKPMFEYFERDDEALLGSMDERRNWSIAPFKNAPANLDGEQRLVLTYTNYDPEGVNGKASNDKALYDRQINKFNRQYAKIWPAYQSNAGTNLCMIRYADVLLMAAEALCQMNDGPTSEAIGYVNQVRQRAYGQLDGRKFIDRIDVTASGTGYTPKKVCVEVIDGTDNTSSVTCFTLGYNPEDAATPADPSNTSMQVYRTGDVKGPLTVAAPVLDENGAVTSIKLLDRGHAYSGTPTVVIRNMDGTDTGSGAEAVAVMRDQAPDYELPDEATADKESFMNAIVDERARELCFEGWRRLDLKRWNLLVEKLQWTRDIGRNATGVSGQQLEFILTPGNNVSDAHLYLPIPANEMMLNPNLEQNPGW